MLGEAPTRGVTQESDTAALQKSLLGVDRRCYNTHGLIWFELNSAPPPLPPSPSYHCPLRFLNADNEMRRIFGSRVVREGAG